MPAGVSLACGWARVCRAGVISKKNWASLFTHSSLSICCRATSQEFASSAQVMGKERSQEPYQLPSNLCRNLSCWSTTMGGCAFPPLSCIISLSQNQQFKIRVLMQQGEEKLKLIPRTVRWTCVSSTPVKTDITFCGLLLIWRRQ